MVDGLEEPDVGIESAVDIGVLDSPLWKQDGGQPHGPGQAGNDAYGQEDTFRSEMGLTGVKRCQRGGTGR